MGDGLTHEVRQAGIPDRVERDPEVPLRGAGVDGGDIDRQRQGEVGENLLDSAREAAPARRDWSVASPTFAGAFGRPGRAREFDGRGEQAPRRATAAGARGSGWCCRPRTCPPS